MGSGSGSGCGLGLGLWAGTFPGLNGLLNFSALIFFDLYEIVIILSCSSANFCIIICYLLILHFLMFSLNFRECLQNVADFLANRAFSP